MVFTIYSTISGKRIDRLFCEPLAIIPAKHVIILFTTFTGTLCILPVSLLFSPGIAATVYRILTNIFDIN
ncbi:MAG: hypothetical protein HQK94_17235 [Nitrospirae bacterium]|nr:hypothetical protein [Nitrospirota bacterium]